MEFCTEDGCFELGVGVGYWQGRRGTENPARPRKRRCRGHYVGICGPEFVRCTVVSETVEAVVDARTGADIEFGGTVELDPVCTNIAALVGAGIVKVVKAEAKAEPKKA